MPNQNFHSLEEIVRERITAARPYAEFLRIPEMSCGVYVLPAGATDRQRPHHEAELYYVMRGAARMTLKGTDGVDEVRDVAAGGAIFVEANREHRFHDITEELAVLVVFAPAQS